jgi:hypothetical protein
MIGGIYLLYFYLVALRRKIIRRDYLFDFHLVVREEK